MPGDKTVDTKKLDSAAPFGWIKIKKQPYTR